MNKYNSMTNTLIILAIAVITSCGNREKTQRSAHEKQIVQPTGQIVNPQTKKEVNEKHVLEAAEKNHVEKNLVTPTTEETVKRSRPDTRIKTPPHYVKDPGRPDYITKDNPRDNELVAGNITQNPDHDPWDRLLKKYVDDTGNVSYGNFKQDAKILQEYLAHLAASVPSGSADKNEVLAYYINLYNAATVKLILDNYPTNSIKNISSPWDRKWVQVGDKKVSLGHIEHKILRRMNEPRIHFAINCASYSCPKLVNEAFTADNMEAKLEKATVNFINDPTRNNITANKLALSNIFKWYKKDFTDNGSLIEYINRYSPISIAADAKIDYLKYDWSLNESK